MISSKTAYTTKELNSLLQVDAHTSITRRAKIESWQSRPKSGRGGGFEWILDSMPEKTRQAIAYAVANNIAKAEAKKLPAIKQELVAINTTSNIPVHKKDRVVARAFIVDMAKKFQESSGTPRTNAYETFCHEYNRGVFDIPAWVKELLPSISRKSICNWEKALNNKGLAGLLGKLGQHRKGSGIIDSTPGMADVVIAHIIKYYNATAKDVLEALEVTHAGQRLPSLRHLQRWMKQYRIDNPSTILKAQNPDAYRSKYQAAFGSRSADVFKLNQLWELDSSPADILLADGKRYTLIGGIDVYTRKACLKLSRTSNAQAVCSLLRRMLLDFGVPEAVKMDNGADYTSYRVATVLFDLQIRPEICTPFSPEEKPHIERFFGTFQRELKKQPNFIGHSVADRKAIESRRSFAERISRKEGKTEERSLWELPYTPEEFQAYCDHYCNNKYGESKHSTLKKSPNEAYALAAAKTPPNKIANERALDILLMPLAGNNGVRKVSKDGILADKGTYIAPKLGELIGDSVLVRLDEENAGYIYVFDLDGIFLCRAEDPNLTGVSRRDIAIAAKKVQKDIENKKVKEIKKITTKISPNELIPHIVEMQKQQAERNRADRDLRFGAVASQEYSTPALEQATAAIFAKDSSTPAPMTEAEAKKRAELEADFILNPPVVAITKDDLSTKEAFHTALVLLERQKTEKLSPAQVKWLHSYLGTYHYSTHLTMYNDFGRIMLEGVETLAI